jgi:hypothetical protein
MRPLRDRKAVNYSEAKGGDVDYSLEIAQTEHRAEGTLISFARPGINNATFYGQPKPKRAAKTRRG